MTKRIAENIDFHDSWLLEFRLSDYLDALEVTLEVPRPYPEADGPRRFLIRFDKLHRVEFEIPGLRSDEYPVEIYDVYSLEDEQWNRWQRQIERLYTAGILMEPEERKVLHVVLASSVCRGLPDRPDLAGISIICRQLIVRELD